MVGACLQQKKSDLNFKVDSFFDDFLPTTHWLPKIFV